MGEKAVTNLAYKVEELSRNDQLQQEVDNLTLDLSTLRIESQERNDQLQQEVDNLASKVEVFSTLRMESQERNDQLQKEVEILLRQNDLLVKKLSAYTQDKKLAHSTPDLVTMDKKSMSQLLASCESFQNKLDAMSDRQHKVEDTLRWLVSKINFEK